MKESRAPPGWSGARVVVLPFKDERPKEFYTSKSFGRYTVEHPEYSLKYSKGDVTRVGHLEEEFPALLARTMPAGAAVMSDRGPRDTDFVVRGRLLQSTTSGRYSRAMLIPGFVGLPYGFHRHRFRVAVDLYATPKSAAPLWSNTYEFYDTKVEGLYYGSTATNELAQAAVATTVAQAAADIARIVGQHRRSKGA